MANDNVILERQYLDELQHQIENRGFALAAGIADSDVVSRLKTAVAGIAENPYSRTRKGSAFGVRNLLQVVPEANVWAWSSPILTIVRAILGNTAKPVKGILFDKTEQANWAVPWHQDVTIAVRERRVSPGYELWSEKAGILHVQPPIEIMQQILAVRLHLDPCPAHNGALRVIPGSHAIGRLTDNEVDYWREVGDEFVCAANAGDALLIRPLLLHASSSSKTPEHRRVMHFEYSAVELPNDLEWAG